MTPPFWQHFKNKPVVLFLGIIALAILIRFYRINEVPYGFYWDEAAITYNAWGIAVWNRDEFGHKLPVSFKSFGDYKAPLVIYLLGGIYKATGLHPEYLRILVASAGVTNVVLIYLLAKKYKLKPDFPALLMAILPWSVHFSRFGVEVTVSLAFILVGVLLLQLALKKPWLYFPAGLAFVLSMYAYHSAKIFTPLLVLVWAGWHFHHLINSRKILIPAVLVSLILLWPQLYDTVAGQGFERGKSLVFFQGGLFKLGSNISAYMRPDFWIFGRDNIGLRHAVPGYGMLYKTAFVLMLIGIFHTIKNKRNRFQLIWLVLGLLPSILSSEAPHAIRSLIALPAVISLAAVGYSAVKFKIIRAGILALILIELVFYQHAYHTSYARASAPAYQYGYKEALISARRYGGTADKFIMTTTYGQPYIYTLLYRKITPEEFKFGALANYEFRSIKWPENRQNYIYIATPEEIPPEDPQVIDVINIPGTDIPVFVIAKT